MRHAPDSAKDALVEQEDLPVFADPGVPDTRSPLRYLWWLVSMQRRRALSGMLLATASMVSLTVQPWLVARAIDDGLRARDSAALLGWCAAILTTGLLLAVLSELKYFTMTRVHVDAYLRTIRVLTRAVVRQGPAVRRKIGAGEIVTISSSDVEQLTVTIMIVGPGVAGVTGYCAIAVSLFGISPMLAVVVLLGVPLMMLLLGPLLGRLQRAEADYRERHGEVTAMAGDIVAGLRVLCGIGGKEVLAGRYRARSAQLREKGYRVAAVTTWIGALSLTLPVVFVAVVTWLAARLAAVGHIGIGEVVAVYGYVIALTAPVSALILCADDVARYPVLARRLLRVLTLEGDVPDTGTRGWPDTPAELHDAVTGLRIPHRGMVAVVATRRVAAIALFERLARFADSAAMYGSIPLNAIRLDEVRRHVLLVDNDAYLFAAPVGEVVSGSQQPDQSRVDDALRTAAAQDVVEALPDGVHSLLTDQATTLSGGQRQRLRVARAVYAAPDVLLMVEPTSAVDAHTETLIADRLYAARADRSTVIATTSSILLQRADVVVYLRDDAILATGTHRDLARDHPGYRALVLRGTSEAEGEPALRPAP